MLTGGTVIMEKKELKYFKWNAGLSRSRNRFKTNRYYTTALLGLITVIATFLSSCQHSALNMGSNPVLKNATVAYNDAVSVGALKYAKEEISNAHRLLIRGRQQIAANSIDEGNLLLKLSTQLSNEAKEITLMNKANENKSQKFNFNLAQAKMKNLTPAELEYEKLLAAHGVIGHVVLNPMIEYTNAPVIEVSGYSIPGSIIRIYGAESDMWAMADGKTGQFDAEVPLAPNKLNQLQVYALNTDLDPGIANIFQDSIIPSAPKMGKSIVMTGYSVEHITGSTEPDTVVTINGSFGKISGTTNASGSFDQKVPINIKTANQITIATIDRAGNVGWPEHYVVFQAGSPPAYALEESKQYIGITAAYQNIFDSSYLDSLHSTYGINKVALNPYGAFVDYTRKFSHSLGVDLSGGFGYAKSNFVFNNSNGTYRMVILSGLIAPEYHILINNFDIHLGPGIGVYYLMKHLDYASVSTSEENLNYFTYNVSAQLGVNYLFSSSFAISGLARLSWGDISNINKQGASLNLGGLYMGVGFVYYLH